MCSCSNNTLELIDIKGICIMLRVKEAWIRKMIRTKKIPYIKIGGHIRFDIEKIKAWLNENGK